MAIHPLRRIPPSWIPDLGGGASDHLGLAKQLCEELDEYLDKSAVDEVFRAYEFGASAHDGQVRLSGEPYITHPVNVARILADMRLDSRSIIAAILHDVLEDTATSKNLLTT